MEKQYKMSTNWSPWLAIGFLLSTLFFGIVSNGWLLFFLIVLSFLPAIIVGLALSSYLMLENNQIKFCYDRKNSPQIDSALNIVDITAIQRIGKSVIFQLDDNTDVTVRVRDAKDLVERVLQQNPRIELQENKK